LYFLPVNPELLLNKKLHKVILYKSATPMKLNTALPTTPIYKFTFFKHYIQWDVEVVVPVKMVHPAGVKVMAIAPAADVTG
jgi:hypothetical protein